jgi:hypothetical protein
VAWLTRLFDYYGRVQRPLSSSIPRVHGNQIKTDRIDAAKLCQFYSAGMLTVVAAPAADVERDRDLMRSRQFMMYQLGLEFGRARAWELVLDLE